MLVDLTRELCKIYIMEISSIIETVKKKVESYKVPVVDLIAIQTKDPFKILVATILSARTKDETTATSSGVLAVWTFNCKEGMGNVTAKACELAMNTKKKIRKNALLLIIFPLFPVNRFPYS